MAQSGIKIGNRLSSTFRVETDDALRPWNCLAWFRKNVADQIRAEAAQLESRSQQSRLDEYSTEADFAIDPELDDVRLAPDVAARIRTLQSEAAFLVEADPVANQIRRTKLDASVPEIDPDMQRQIRELEDAIIVDRNGPNLNALRNEIMRELESLHFQGPRAMIVMDEERDVSRLIDEQAARPLELKRLKEAAADDLRQRTLAYKKASDTEELALREASEHLSLSNRRRANELLDAARDLREEALAEERLRQRSHARERYKEKLVFSDGGDSRKEARDRDVERARLLREVADRFENEEQRDVSDDVDVSDFALARHAFLVGKSGYGKTRLVTHMLTEQMKAGCSVIYIDPKPDATRVLLSAAIAAGVPAEDVVIIDPMDGFAVPGWNPFLIDGATPDMAAATLKEFIRNTTTNWGVFIDQTMEYAFCVAAHHNLSLYEAVKLIENPVYRRALLDIAPNSGGSRIYDEAVEFFTYRFTGGETSRESVTVRIRELLRRPFAESLLCSQSNTFDLAELWTKQKVVIARLDERTLGQDGAQTIAGLLANQTFLTAMHVGSESTRPVVLALDELGTQEKFLGARLSELTSYSRSQGLRLLVACQYLSRVSTELLDALLGITQFRAYFQLGLDDAKRLSEELAAITSGQASSSGAHLTLRLDGVCEYTGLEVVSSGGASLYEEPLVQPQRRHPVHVDAWPNRPAPPPQFNLPKPTFHGNPPVPPVSPVRPSLIDDATRSNIQQLRAQTSKFLKDSERRREEHKKLMAEWEAEQLRKAKSAHIGKSLLQRLNLAAPDPPSFPPLPFDLPKDPHPRRSPQPDPTSPGIPRWAFERYDEEERQRRDYDEAEKNRTGVFAEYDKKRQSYLVVAERFASEKREYEGNLRRYEVGVASHNTAVRTYEAKCQEYDEACRRVNEQQYYHDCQKEEDDEAQRAYEEEVKRRRVRKLDNAMKYYRERLDIVAYLEASQHSQVIPLMQELWDQFDGNEFYMCVPGMEEPAEIVEFLLSLPACNGNAEQWSAELDCSEGYPAITLRVPAVAWSVEAVPPPPTERKDWLDALCVLEDQTAVVRSTLGRGAKPHVDVVRIADVPDALPYDSRSLQEFIHRSFQENGLPPDVVSATFEERAEQIRTLAASYPAPDMPQRSNGRGARPPRIHNDPQQAPASMPMPSSTPKDAPASVPAAPTQPPVSPANDAAGETEEASKEADDGSF